MLCWDLTHVPSGTDRRPGVSTSTTRDGRRGLRAIECGKPACAERTVYNTLKILVDCGLLQQVTVEASRVFYDSNISPHHHFFDIDSGELKDIEAEQFEILGMPEPPPGKSVAGVDVVVRLKSTG